MFGQLEEINAKPDLFERYSAEALWDDEYRSAQMLAFHLNEDLDVSSRNIAFIDRSATWIIDTFQLGPDISVCDFGCGPGLYASRLAASGARVTGLDFSKRSIQYARDRARDAGQTINYVRQDYLEYAPDATYDLITMIMCDFCALSPAQRERLLAIFHDCLRDDGSILLDVYSLAAYAEREEACYYEKNQLNRFWCEEDYYCFVNTFKYGANAVVLDKYSIFSESGKVETVYNWLQYFGLTSLAEELSRAGFGIEQAYRDVCGQPYSEEHSEFAVVVGKKV